MALSTLQTSFLGGELSPSMYSRVDDSFYKIGAAKLSNFLIKPTGILQKRAGFRFVKEFDASKKIRLIPFRFSSEQTLVLIFTERRMYISTEGQILLSSNGQPYSVSTPYDDEDLAGLEYSQNADIVTLTSLNYPPYELRRYGATDWRFETIKTTPSLNPPSYVSAYATYPDDVLNGSTDINDDNYNPNTASMDVIEARYVVTAIDKDNIESEPSEPEIVDCNYYIEGATVNVSWGAVSGAQSYRVYRYVSGIYGFLAETTELSITDDGTVPDASLTPPRYKDPFTGTAEEGRINSIQVLSGGSNYWNGAEEDTEATYYLDLKISDSTGSGAKAQALAKKGVIQSVRIIASGKGYKAPTVTVVSTSGEGASFNCNLSGKGNSENPRCSCQFDQRRIFAGSIMTPLKVWMTQAGSQNLMSYHVPIQDTDRIEIVAVTNDADMIKHAVALESLILFTGSSEMRVYTQNSQALSPSSVAVRAQSYVGANDVQPLVSNNSIVYVSARGGHPRQISYSYNSAAYTSDDLGVRCPHMFDGKDIIDLSLSKAPVPLIYAVSTDGTLKVCIYIPEQQIVGWFTYETKGKIESACAVAEGLEDRLYIIVRRTIKGTEHLYLEHMALTDPKPENFRCMDSFLDAVFTNNEKSIEGLNHLEGEEVCVFVDGKQQKNKVVENGGIELDEAGKSVSIGLPVTATLITMPVEYASASIITHQRVMSKLLLRCSGTGDIWTGVYPQTEADKMYPCDKSEAFHQIQNQESYVVPVSITGSWDPQTQLIVESRDCYPMRLMSLLCDAEYTQAAKTNTNKKGYTY